VVKSFDGFEYTLYNVFDKRFKSFGDLALKNMRLAVTFEIGHLIEIFWQKRSRLVIT